MLRHLVRTLIAASVALGGVALAQDAEPPAAASPAPAPAAAPAAPAPAAAPPGQPAQATNNDLVVNEMVGDWSVRCFRVQSIAPCDILQLASRQGTNQRVLLVSIAYIPSQNSYAAQIVVPLGVTLSNGLTIETQGAVPPLKFTRCERDGCYFEGPFPNAGVDALRSMTGRTDIKLIAYGTNQAVSLPLSLNGFVQALDRLRVEARRRATNTP
jgi:invasion protein IalB